MPPIRRGMEWLEGRSRSFHAVLTLLLIAVIGVINFYAGPRVILSTLFLVPVVYAVWYLGFNYALLATSICLIPSALWRWEAGFFLDIPWSLFIPFLGRVGIFCFVIVVLAELKKMIRRQREAHADLLSAYGKIQQLARVKSDFAAQVSHDLRAPLAAMRESVAILLDGLMGEMSREQKECLEITRKNVDRLRRLIDAILDFSQMEQGKRAFHFASNDLRKDLGEAVELFRPLAAKKDVEIKIELPDEEIRARYDSVSIQQVINNLLSNAIKFIEKGAVAVGCSVKGTSVCAYVKDTGPGIAAENLGFLFKPFARLPPPDRRHHEGAGLGLAISKQLIERHGGKIWAESRAGEGTTFYFTLPRG